jgi:hypothetical protein
VYILARLRAKRLVTIPILAGRADFAKRVEILAQLPSPRSLLKGERGSPCLLPAKRALFWRRVICSLQQRVFSHPLA